MSSSSTIGNVVLYILSTFAISAVASLFAVFFVWLGRISAVWASEKWIHRIIWASITDVRGQWVTENEDDSGNEMTEVMQLKQRGGALWGTIHYNLKVPGADPVSFETKTFNVRGFIRERIVVLTYRNQDATRQGAGCMCLECIMDNQQLRGKSIGWEPIASRITLTPGRKKDVLTWTRVHKAPPENKM